MIDWETFRSQLQTNPGKVLKSVLLLAGCFLVIWILVIMQSDLDVHDPIENSGRLDSLNVRIAPGLAGDTLGGATRKIQMRNIQNKAPEPGFFSLLPLLLLFLIGLAGVWFWLRSKNNNGQMPDGTIFTIVATQQLPGGKLLVGRLNSEYWVMATGSTQGITLLHRYSADEWEGTTEKQPKSNWKKTFTKALHSAPPKTLSQNKKPPKSP